MQGGPAALRRAFSGKKVRPLMRALPLVCRAACSRILKQLNCCTKLVAQARLPHSLSCN